MYIEIMNVVKERTKKRKCAYQHRTARRCCTGIDDHVHTHAHTHTHTRTCVCVCVHKHYTVCTLDTNCQEYLLIEQTFNEHFALLSYLLLHVMYFFSKRMAHGYQA